MTTNDEKIVTHEDREALTYLNLAARGADLTPDERQLVDGLLDRLIAAAEADQPPLPEGWYVWDDVRAVWFDGKRALYTAPGRDYFGPFTEASDRDRLTPLHPTVTDADIERAARAARAANLNGVDEWDETRQHVRNGWMKTVRAALDALDIETQS